MLKKLIISAVLVCFSFGFAQAETMIFGAGAVLMKCDKTEGIGAATLIGIGQEISKQVILWGNFTNQKTNEGESSEQFLAGVSVLSQHLIPELKAGGYLQAEGGLDKESGQQVVWGSLMGLGLYFDVNENNRLWLGWGYNGIHLIQAGLSIDIQWR